MRTIPCTLIWTAVHAVTRKRYMFTCYHAVMRPAGGIYRQLVQRQLQSGFSAEHLPTIAENGRRHTEDEDKDNDNDTADDTARSDTDDETLYVH